MLIIVQDPNIIYTSYMCGIYGHIRKAGSTSAANMCLHGLEKLEYRGYDSAGIAGILEGKIVSCKSVGNVSNLHNIFNKNPLKLEIAIAHTRWATHGSPSEKNAHPHVDQNQEIALVHNGIIENYLELQKELQDKGVLFSSETDSEVIAQYIAYQYKGDIIQAIRNTIKKLQGSFAIACIHKKHPDCIFTATRFCPLMIGICQSTEDVFLSSDVNAFIGRPLDIFSLYEDEIAKISTKEIQCFDKNGNICKKTREHITITGAYPSKNGFDHYLVKEVYEQPDILSCILRKRILPHQKTPYFPEIDDHLKKLSQVESIIILACGSSYHAGLLVAPFIEKLVQIPVRVEIASEMRYKTAFISPKTLALAISQSGETADTLAALENLSVFFRLGLCNVARSLLFQKTDATIHIDAGPEISVCSTKAFTSQVLQLMLFAIKLADIKKRPTSYPLEVFNQIPFWIQQVLEKRDEIQSYAQKYKDFTGFFFVGRQYMYPTALEASLKFKEISYLDASGYPSGEMKHGPIALISLTHATIALCGNTDTLEKMTSNLKEIQARSGPILAFAPKSATHLKTITKDIVWMPDQIPNELSPIPYSVAMQLLAYETAKLHDREIDKPRNLAKSVTVE